VNLQFRIEKEKKNVCPIQIRTFSGFGISHRRVFYFCWHQQQQWRNKKKKKKLHSQSNTKKKLQHMTLLPKNEAERKNFVYT
jgi:hypothetical protein